MKNAIRAVAYGGVAATLFLGATANRHRGCSDFEKNDIVEVLDGTQQGAVGVVLKYRDVNSRCYYLFRGQRGIEQPFNVWLEPSSLELYKP